MSSFDVPIGSFAYSTAGNSDFQIKCLGIAPFDARTADAGVYPRITESYMKVISSFNFPVGTEVVIPRRRDMSSFCPLGFSAAYVDQLRAGLSLLFFLFSLGFLTTTGLHFLNFNLMRYVWL